MRLNVHRCQDATPERCDNCESRLGQHLFLTERAPPTCSVSDARPNYFVGFVPLG